jgi:hypothetical protein
MVWAVPLSTTDLSTRSLTPDDCTGSIRSLIGFGTLVEALAHSVLYHPRLLIEASPKAISERTSYHGI